MSINRRSAQLLAASCAGVGEVISRHMPAGPYRDIMSWAFSARNPRRQEFLQATGMTQLISMNSTLLSGLVADADWPRLLPYAGHMNAHQIFEVISDNLANGLGEVQLDAAAQQRRFLVSALNRAMLDALQPERSTPAVLLLAGLPQQTAQQASGLHSNLAAATLADVSAEYAQHHPGSAAAPTSAELAYGTWAALVTNVEACREVLTSLAGTASEPLVRQGLTDRYRAVERCLHADYLSRLELAALGQQTIMVGPTLGYLLAVLAEIIVPLPAYPRLLADSTVSEVLAEAALLVRLLNDVGTILLQLSPAQQAAQLQPVIQAASGAATPAEALATLCVSEDSAAQPGSAVVFTRLRKDLINSEINIALWHARRATDAAGTWRALTDSLAFCAALYAQHRSRLQTGLGFLDEQLGDSRISTVIERFVRFHERMYAQPHTDQAGEYAL